MTDEQYMQLAIQKAREGIAAGQSPFGAVVIRDAQVVAAAHNTVWRDSDPTAHAGRSASFVANCSSSGRAAARVGPIDVSVQTQQSVHCHRGCRGVLLLKVV